MTTHNRFVGFSSEFVFWNEAMKLSLIAMKHLKLNLYYWGWQQVDMSIYLFDFFHSQNQRAKAGLMAVRSWNFHAMYLAAGIFMFTGDAAEPHSLRSFKSSTKEQTCKRINKK